MMRTIITMIIVGSMTLIPVQTFASSCKEQTSAAARAAQQEFAKVKKNFDDLMPEPSDYTNAVKDCIGSVVNWTAVIGFKLPSIDDLLKMLCKEFKSHMEIPKFDFHFDKTFGMDIGSTFYEVPMKANDNTFKDIWSGVWEE